MLIHQGRIFSFGTETATLPNGVQVELEIVRHPGASAVLPLHDDGTVTLVRQYRHAAGGMIVEVPAGLAEAGEDPEVCAARELAEEVYLKGELELLTVMHTTPGFTDERIWLYRATGLQPAHGQRDPDEFIEILRLPLGEAVAMVRDGRITDGKTICALLLSVGAAGPTSTP